MEIAIKDVVGGLDYVGKTVFICDYRKDGLKKPIRHVRPTEVMVLDKMAEIAKDPKLKKVYYSLVYLAPVTAKGYDVKKSISPYDQTCFRMYSGVGVRVFDNMAECQECYTEQVSVAIDNLIIEKLNITDNITKQIEEMKALIQ